MKHSPVHHMRRIVGVICLAIVCGLLAAGLWPFNLLARNDVSWLKDQNGLQFGKNGRVFGLEKLEDSNLKDESFCSLEVWLQPAPESFKRSATFLTFSTARNPLQFRLRQALGSLLLRRDYREERSHRMKTAEIDIADAFRQGEQDLFTITSNTNGTVVYRDGVLMGNFPRFSFGCKDFLGQLVIGGSALTYNNWQGKILGIAMYRKELMSEEALQHYTAWIGSKTPEALKRDRTLLALYFFEKRSGRIIDNDIGSRPQLYVPRIFSIPRKKILALPWEEPSSGLDDYVESVFINIVGFVPFGFFLFGYLTWNRDWNRAALATILLGALLSLTIEILQAFIPARLSGVTDIITNTLGTCIGVMLWKWRPVRLLAGRLKELSRSS
jgi:hypothetical protein